MCIRDQTWISYVQGKHHTRSTNQLTGLVQWWQMVVNQTTQVLRSGRRITFPVSQLGGPDIPLLCRQHLLADAVKAIKVISSHVWNLEGMARVRNGFKTADLNIPTLHFPRAPQVTKPRTPRETSRSGSFRPFRRVSGGQGLETVPIPHLAHSIPQSHHRFCLHLSGQRPCLSREISKNL